MYPGATLWLLLTLLATSQAANNPEVSWGDWIIVDETEPGTSILLRRITPKSVFVAPTFNSCSEGYRQDSQGRCVKLVKVNQQAQWDFFLERLNSMYAPSSTSKNTQKETGPLHINLPIGSENSPEDAVVKKRLPPKVVNENKLTSSTQATTTMSQPPLTAVQELTTQEVLMQTVVDNSDAISNEQELDSQAESTTEVKRYTTTESSMLMLGDQPVNSEYLTDTESPETPKNSKESPSQLPDKPFVIIVTNEPTTNTEETTNNPTTSFNMPMTTEEEEEEIDETSSTAEVTTEGTTETNARYTTESTPKTTEYELNVSEKEDLIGTSVKPAVKEISSLSHRPNCGPSVSHVRDDIIDSSECEPTETEVLSNDRKVILPSASLPVSLPLLEPSSHVRFPSESFVPVRKTQSFVRFPGEASPHEDRPNFWWPSWQIRKHPGIRGWPPSEDPSPEQAAHKQYPLHGQWADPNAWHRRFFQRD